MGGRRLVGRHLHILGENKLSCRRTQAFDQDLKSPNSRADFLNIYLHSWISTTVDCK